VSDPHSPREVLDGGPPVGPFAEGTLPPGFRLLAHEEEIGSLRLGDLSDWFNPFLRHFMSESLRCGGEVLLAEEDGVVGVVYLYSPAERIASVFTRSRALAEAMLCRRDRISMYSPYPLRSDAEPYLIYEGPADAPDGRDRFRFPIRIASRTDRPRIVALLREVYGEVDEQWIATMPEAVERCFLAEVDGEIAGVAWASLVEGVGRLHSLSVRPRFRRLGIGTDLFRARCLWLGAAGATRTISEIAERNRPSRRIAEAGGMREVGRIFRLERETTTGSRS